METPDKMEGNENKAYGGKYPLIRFLPIPTRVEVQDDKGNWNFASYAYDPQQLLDLMWVVFGESKIRVYENGGISFEKEGEEIKDFRIN